MKKPIEWLNEEQWPQEDFELLYSLVYCSRVRPEVDAGSITRIVDAAKRYNTQHAITGLLVMGENIFLQWLEGTREEITVLMGRIREDWRHFDILILSKWEDVHERRFPDWTMEFVAAGDICNVLSRALKSAKDLGSIQALQRLLKQLDDGGLAALPRH